MISASVRAGILWHLICAHGAFRVSTQHGQMPAAPSPAGLHRAGPRAGSFYQAKRCSAPELESVCVRACMGSRGWWGPTVAITTTPSRHCHHWLGWHTPLQFGYRNLSVTFPVPPVEKWEGCSTPWGPCRCSRGDQARVSGFRGLDLTLTYAYPDWISFPVYMSSLLSSLWVLPWSHPWGLYTFQPVTVGDRPPPLQTCQAVTAANELPQSKGERSLSTVRLSACLEALISSTQAISHHVAPRSCSEG